MFTMLRMLRMLRMIFGATADGWQIPLGESVSV